MVNVLKFLYNVLTKANFGLPISYDKLHKSLRHIRKKEKYSKPKPKHVQINSQPPCCALSGGLF